MMRWVTSLHRRLLVAAIAGLDKADAGVASLIPAWRAGRVDPITVLR
jgi:ABC-type lipoprotein release transport system permease subunit